MSPVKVLISRTDLTVDFEWETNRTKDEEDEDMVFSPELERIVAQEDRKMKPHQEETEIVNLGVGNERK